MALKLRQEKKIENSSSCHELIEPVNLVPVKLARPEYEFLSN